MSGLEFPLEPGRAGQAAEIGVRPEFVGVISRGRIQADGVVDPVAANRGGHHGFPQALA